MSDPLLKPCPKCGSSDGTERAFVRYEANPNDAQEECEWADKLPETLHAFVCTECSYIKGTVDAREPERLPDGTDDRNDFRVDEELR